MYQCIRTRKAFTLVELLVVVAIIALLLGILLPALAAVRERARNVASKAQLESLATACNTYEVTFGSSPGFFSEDQMTANSSSYGNFTGTQNLMFSLMGGLITSGGTTLFGGMQYDVDEIGNGPLAGNRRYGAFYSPKAGELATVEIGGPPGSNYIQELKTIVDASSGVPILYFRATGGNTPVDVRTSSDDIYGWVSNWAYLNAEPMTTVKGNTYNQKENSLLSNNGASNSAVTTNMAWMVTNPTLSDWSDNPNGSNDVVRGGYTLMSAGADGIYANKQANNGNQSAISSEADYTSFDSNNDDQFSFGGN